MLLSLALGCTGVDVLHIAPIWTPDQSVVLSIATADTTTYRVIAPRDAERIVKTASADERIVLEAFLYDRPLDLPPGDLQPASGALTRSLPDPDAAYVAEISSGSVSDPTWLEAAPSGLGLDTLLLDDPSLQSCQRYEPRSVLLVQEDSSERAVNSTLTSTIGVVLFVTQERVFAWRGGEAVDEVRASSPNTDLSLTGMVRAPKGGLISCSRLERALLHAPFSTERLDFEVFAPFPGDVVPFEASAGPQCSGVWSTSSGQILVLFNDGTLRSLESSGDWRQVHSFQAGPKMHLNAFAESPSGAVFVGCVSDLSILEITEDRVRVHSLPRGGVGSLHWNEELGLIAGTSSGDLFRLVGQDLQDLDEPDFALEILALAPAPDGFFFAGAEGLFGQYIKDVGFCPANPRYAGFTVRQITPFGDALALSGSPVTAQLNISVLEPAGGS